MSCCGWLRGAIRETAMSSTRSFLWLGVIVLTAVAGAVGIQAWAAIPIGAIARMMIRNPGERQADERHQTPLTISMVVSLGMGLLECGMAWGVGAAAHWLMQYS